jgi:hypothetical protein
MNRNGCQRNTFIQESFVLLKLRNIALQLFDLCLFITQSEDRFECGCAIFQFLQLFFTASPDSFKISLRRLKISP